MDESDNNHGNDEGKQVSENIPIPQCSRVRNDSEVSASEEYEQHKRWGNMKINIYYLFIEK